MSDENIDKDVFMDLSNKDLYTSYNEYSSSLSGVFYYQNQQIEFRTIGIKILLGTFAFLGYLYFYNIGLDKFSINIISAILPMLSFFWMIIIMKTDLIYREGLKISFFDASIDLEKTHHWIPSFHSCLISETDIHRNPGMRQGMFYFISLIILLALSFLGISKIKIFSLFYFKFGILIVMVLLLVLYLKKVVTALRIIDRHLVSKKIESKYYKVDKDPQKKMFISMLHSKGREYIEHYSSIKMKYKNLVLLIITALIAGLSYVSGIKQENIHINHIYVNSFIVIMAVIGTSLVRYLDLNISHRQIKLLFDLLISIENEYSFLSPFYSRVKSILYDKKTSPVLQDYMYYGGINLGLIILGITTVLLKMHQRQEFNDVIICFTGFGFLLLWELITAVFLFRAVNGNKM